MSFWVHFEPTLACWPFSINHRYYREGMLVKFTKNITGVPHWMLCKFHINFSILPKYPWTPRSIIFILCTALLIWHLYLDLEKRRCVNSFASSGCVLRTTGIHYQKKIYLNVIVFFSDFVHCSLVWLPIKNTSLQSHMKSTYINLTVDLC